MRGECYGIQPGARGCDLLEFGGYRPGDGGEGLRPTGCEPGFENLITEAPFKRSEYSIKVTAVKKLGVPLVRELVVRNCLHWCVQSMLSA